MATDVFMPSADALVAMAAGGVQHSVTVEKIIADAMSGGNATSIDAILNALPNGQAMDGIATVDSLASGFDANVPAWDMGHGATFTNSGTDFITTEALVLHHDAIQPAVNG
jgi:hypothetical protein